MRFEDELRVAEQIGRASNLSRTAGRGQGMVYGHKSYHPQFGERYITHLYLNGPAQVPKLWGDKTEMIGNIKRNIIDDMYNR